MTYTEATMIKLLHVDWGEVPVTEALSLCRKAFVSLLSVHSSREAARKSTSRKGRRGPRIAGTSRHWARHEPPTANPSHHRQHIVQLLNCTNAPGRAAPVLLTCCRWEGSSSLLPKAKGRQFLSCSLTDTHLPNRDPLQHHSTQRHGTGWRGAGGSGLKRPFCSDLIFIHPFNRVLKG